MSNKKPLDDSESASLPPDEKESEKPDIVSLQAAVDDEKAKSLRYLSNWQRSEADFANYKKRNEQERSEYIKFAGSSFICGLLPVLDDLERALGSVPPEIAESKWIDGIKLIARKLLTTLENQGVSEIEALDKDFDPRYHDAVAQCPGKEGKIMDVTQKGYKIHDRVLRPAAVLVGKGNE